MEKEFYRIRSINSLLGEYNELESQSIYFAAPESLNDPMEGFMDIYWKGDFIAWRNLFRHYLLCLLNMYQLLRESGTEVNLENDHIPIFSGMNDFPTQRHKNQFNALTKLFFDKECIKSLTQRLSSRTIPIRRDELLFYLNLIHMVSLNTIISMQEKSGIALKFEMLSIKMEKQITKIVDSGFIDKIEQSADRDGSYEHIQSIFFAGQHLLKEGHLQYYCNGIFDINESNTMFVTAEFPVRYFCKLELLIYPKWYTACFMSEYTNSSAWGHYGSNHSGVCLVFTPEIKDGHTYIELESHMGYFGPDPIIEFSDFESHPVDYINGFSEVDFFRMIGTLPIPKLNSTWYSHNKKMSLCADEMINNTQEWRKNRWVKFIKSVTTKSKDWSYENEHRLILDNTSHDFSHPKDRALKYKFNSLKGIAFGIKTSLSDKLKIMEIIEGKCKKHNRKDFDYYQAYYSHSTGCIERMKIEPSK